MEILCALAAIRGALSETILGHRGRMILDTLAICVYDEIRSAAWAMCPVEGELWKPRASIAKVGVFVYVKRPNNFRKLCLVESQGLQ